MPEQITP